MKTYTIVSRRERTGRESEITGTLQELIQHHSYTLECGKSWEHEKGNHKINMNPKSIKTLVKNLNWATNNSAANGYSGITYFSK